MLAAMLLPLKNPPALDDGMRHLAMAGEMRREGLGDVRGWGHFFFAGYFTEHDSDPWFLSDVLLIPFSLFPTTTGLKLFILFSAALLLLSMSSLLRTLRVPDGQAAVLLALLFFGSTPFLWRLLLGRPFVLMTAVSLCVLAWILRGRWWAVGGAMAIAVLLSHLFLFPAGLTVLGILWLFTAGRRRDALQLAMALAAGITLGFLLHPAREEYIHYLFTVFLRIPFLKDIHLGSEMYGGDLGSTVPVLILLGAASLLHALAYRRKIPRDLLRRRGVLLLEIVVTGFFALFALWRRSIDFLWPSGLALIGALLGVLPHAPRALQRLLAPSILRKKNVFLPMLSFFLAVNVFTVGGQLLSENANNDLEAFRASLAPLPPGARVLNVQWAVIPPLLSVRPDLRYATGIDATFTYVHDPVAHRLLFTGLYKPYELLSVTEGERWLGELLQRFPADAIVVWGSRPLLLALLRRSARLKELPREGVLQVFVVRGRGEK